MSTAATTATTDARQRSPRPAENLGRPGRSPARRREARTAWILCAPFLILFTVFVAGPVLASLGMSFTDIRSADLRSPLSVGVVGIENYAELVGDETFWRALINTGIFVAI